MEEVKADEEDDDQAVRREFRREETSVRKERDTKEAGKTLVLLIKRFRDTRPA